MYMSVFMLNKLQDCLGILPSSLSIQRLFTEVSIILYVNFILMIITGYEYA